MKVYKEKTHDNGYTRKCYASDNFSEYQLTSAYAHDLYTDFLKRYSRLPSARWFNGHFRFERIK